MPHIVLTTLNAKYIHAAFGLRYLLGNLGPLRGRAALLEFDINQLFRLRAELVEPALIRADISRTIKGLAKQFASIVVDAVKLRDYCLSETHPRGRHKARVFRSRLGLSGAHCELLRSALLEAAKARADDLQPGEADEYGQRYVLDFPINTSAGTGTIRSAWIVLSGENVLRFVSCYLL